VASEVVSAPAAPELEADAAAALLHLAREARSRADAAITVALRFVDRLERGRRGLHEALHRDSIEPRERRELRRRDLTGPASHADIVDFDFPERPICLAASSWER
jgi:hypothetical protein